MLHRAAAAYHGVRCMPTALAAFLAVASLVHAEAPIVSTDRAALSEASMNFDQEGVEPLLLRLAGVVDSGFSHSDARALATRVAELELEQAGTWSYSVSFEGQSVPLVVEAFQDDHEAPDLYFFSTPSLAARIDSELKRFAEEQGW